MDRKKWVLIISACVLSIVLIYVVATPYFAPSIAPNIVKADPDGDGLFNEQERELGTDPLKSDTDNDGLDDGLEVELNTSPVDYDTDGDGLGDGAEREIDIDPLDIDSDDDGLEDGFEVNSFGTNPSAKDTDLDGLSDKEEQNYGTNPLSSDSDGDGASDHNEIFVRHTDPLTPDVILMLTLRDEETNSKVRGVKVYVDGTDVGTTTEQGTISLDVISIGQHRVSIAYTGYGTLDIGYVTVEKDTTFMDLFVDMPNPELMISLHVDEWLAVMIPPNEMGKATVTVGNQGDLPSKDTMALVTVYDAEASKVLDQALIRLGSIAIGETKAEESGTLDTSYWHNEYVLVVLFDGSEYLPEKDLRSMISAPGSVADNLANAVFDYLATNPELVGTIIGTAIKVIAGI